MEKLIAEDQTCTLEFVEEWLGNNIDLSKLKGLIDYLDPSLDGLTGATKAAFRNNRETRAWQNIRHPVKIASSKKSALLLL